MAGTLLERQLTAPRARRVDMTVANRADDADLRRLLRDNPTKGQISLSFEREPDYFAETDLPGEAKQTIAVREGGCLVGAGSCAVRRRFVNGVPQRVGYLGGLRLDARYAGRFDLLRRGYEFFRELQSDSPADYYFTSIASDNGRARKFLERGLPGMPRYEFAGEFVTLLVPTGGGLLPRRPLGRGDEIGRISDFGALVSRLNDHNRHRQFSPWWSVEELSALARLGLRMEDFCCLHNRGNLMATAALWDQRSFKQTVVRGYTPWLAGARPVLNAARSVIGGSRLPRIGVPVANAFLSHLAMAGNDMRGAVALIAELRRNAARRQIELLTIGFAAADPALATVLRHFGGHEYRTRLYMVSWPGIGGAAGSLDGRTLAPEVALL